MSNYMELGHANIEAHPWKLLINNNNLKKHKCLYQCSCVQLCQRSTVPVSKHVCACACEVNEAALYCNNSNDHQRTRAHLRASDHRVKWRGRINMGTMWSENNAKQRRGRTATENLADVQRRHHLTTDERKHGQEDKQHTLLNKPHLLEYAVNNG